MSHNAKTEERENAITLNNIIDDFSTAMLVTQTPDDQLRARPMQIASNEGTDLWFVTGRTSGKIDELVEHPSVCVTLQSKTKYASLTGRMGVSEDRKLIDEMWQESWKVWYPKGKDDPDIVLLRFESAEGEFWDNSGTKGLGMMIEFGKAYWSGRRPDVSDASHAKVDLD